MTPDEIGSHTTHIEHLPIQAKWVPYCDLCGRITPVAEDYMEDAVAIAERHQAIGGFEPFS